MPIQHSVFIAYQTEKTVQIWATELNSIVNDDGDIRIYKLSEKGHILNMAHKFSTECILLLDENVNIL